MQRLLAPLVALAAMAQPLAAQAPAQEARHLPGLVHFHLARSVPSTAWTVGGLVYVWQSDWGNAVCIRFIAASPGGDSATFRIPQIDSLEIAVDSAGRRLRTAEAQASPVVWVPYPLATLKRADASCPEP